MYRRVLLGAVAVAALAYWSSPAPAHVKGLALITHGYTISHLGPGIHCPRPAGSATAVGYKYNYFGVFRIDLWAWGGTYCLYRNDLYWELTPAEAAELLNKPRADLGQPFLYRCPPGVLILLLVVGCLLLRAALRKAPGHKLYALLKERRYLKALAIFHDYAHAPPEGPPAAMSEAITAAPQAGTAVPPAPPEEERERARQAAGFHAALEYLASQGVEPEKAGRKLAALLSRPQPATPVG
jgi:hypothetical protein